MVQIQEIKHIDTKDLTDKLRKIGINIMTLEIKINIDGLPLINISGRYIGEPIENESTSISTWGGIISTHDKNIKI